MLCKDEAGTKEAEPWEARQQENQIFQALRAQRLANLQGALTETTEASEGTGGDVEGWALMTRANYRRRLRALRSRHPALLQLLRLSRPVATVTLVITGLAVSFIASRILRIH